mmetsp:Transcript_28143/g.95879  ORF Transcript_28143/g.95879 Transcript_28143/m.95879 type:complete len:304 (-) Transcript_28143:484-1395(-)
MNQRLRTSATRATSTAPDTALCPATQFLTATTLPHALVPSAATLMNHCMYLGSTFFIMSVACCACSRLISFPALLLMLTIISGVMLLIIFLTASGFSIIFSAALAMPSASGIPPAPPPAAPPIIAGSISCAIFIMFSMSSSLMFLNMLVACFAISGSMPGTPGLAAIIAATWSSSISLNIFMDCLSMSGLSFIIFCTSFMSGMPPLAPAAGAAGTLSSSSSTASAAPAAASPASASASFSAASTAASAGATSCALRRSLSAFAMSPAAFRASPRRYSAFRFLLSRLSTSVHSASASVLRPSLT